MTRYIWRSCLADQGLLDASDLLAYDTGVRQLLGLHAHLTHRPRPKGRRSDRWSRLPCLWQGSSYRLLQGTSVVQIVEFIAEQAVKGTAGYTIKKAAKYGYERLLKDSLEPILRRKPSSMPARIAG